MSLCEKFLEPGANCWRKVHADRVGVLFSGSEFFAAVRQAMIRAKRRIVIVGWDFNTKTRLLRGETPDDGFPTELGPFLEAILRSNPDLEIFVLIWDYSFIYATERESVQSSDLLRNPPPRLQFSFDSELPAAASHHQKIVLVDDSLAFSGGLDLSAWRWDTPKHHLDDKRRKDPSGDAYQPYHDIQMVVAGAEVVDAFSELCEYRWLRANGVPLSALVKTGAPEGENWFPETGLELANAELGIARTYAAFEPYPEVREIERLHLDIIERAERYLYFENQYFSSNRIAEAIAKRLSEEDGPEVVIVLNKDTGGWLEESTMGLARDCLFEQLTEADAHGRLRLYYPAVHDSGGEPTRVYVHAKVIIADDCLLKIGSANLSNRSMRVDSELDIVFADTARESVVREFRNSLVAIHFGKEAEEIAAAFDDANSFCGVFDGLLDVSGSSLRRIELTKPNGVARKMAKAKILDPDEPLDPQFWIRNRIVNQERSSIGRRLLFFSGIVAFGIGLVFLAEWAWGDALDKGMLENKLEAIRSSSWSLFALVLVFIVAGLLAFPLTFLLVASVVVFGPVATLLCGYGGSHLAALVAFGLGRLAGKPLLKKFPSDHVTKLERQLGKRGVLSVALIRLLPVAPFPVVNLAAGSLRLKFSTFNLGTLLGMFPGMLGVVWLTYQVEHAIKKPGWESIAMLLAAVIAVVAVIYFLYRSVKSPSTAEKSDRN